MQACSQAMHSHQYSSHVVIRTRSLFLSGEAWICEYEFFAKVAHPPYARGCNAGERKRELVGRLAAVEAVVRLHTLFQGRGMRVCTAPPQPPTLPHSLFLSVGFSSPHSSGLEIILPRRTRARRQRVSRPRSARDER